MELLFIGVGNMGGAIVKSLYKNGENHKIHIAGRGQKKLDEMRNFGEFEIFDKKNLEKIEMIFLGIKPYQMEEVIQQHLENVNSNQIIVSMAAGITLEKLENCLGDDKKIVRIMPNTPIMVDEGMTSITANKNCSEDDIKKVIDILKNSSRCALISEDKIDAFIGMAGSSPAFAYIFLEAMSDAGVKYGLTREETYLFASQALIGAGKMLRENIMNPGAFKDAVTSPGGTTIEGVCALEENGFRNAIIKAVSKTVEKSLEMNKKTI
ncbi:MAG: pyrroline-5-carboxylate reductase [Fusobacteriaceae bacterium]